MGAFFWEITIVIVLSALLSILFRLLKQPAILAYILAGIIVGPFGDLQLQSKEVLRLMGEFGVTLLLFMVGLELRLGGLKSVGKVALICGILQIIFTWAVGSLISSQLGFSPLNSFYISLALTFSSTIIIIKLLSDKKDLNSLYGKISLGVLLVQDAFVILILIFLSGFNTIDKTGLLPTDVLISLIKAVMLFGLLMYLSRSILPKLVDKIAHSGETLFLFSIAWALGLSALVGSPLVGFSIEIGGFLAGLSLANSSESFQIVGRVRSLRDFFVVIFFVLLGMNMSFTSIEAIWMPAFILSAFVLIGKPFIVMAIMSVLGYRKRTSFLVGLTNSQISEFSLILLFLGVRVGHIDSQIVSLVTMVGIITFAISTYLILYNGKIFRLLGGWLDLFEWAHPKREESEVGELKNHVVLIGANRTGRSILNALKDEGENVVVIDFDPDIVNELKEEKVLNLFGDISDSHIQEKAQLKTAKLIISTIPDADDNMLLIDGLKHFKNRAKIIVAAYNGRDAKKLYRQGADYVIIPHLIGGRHIAKLIEDNGLEKLSRLKEKDLPYLN